MTFGNQKSWYRQAELKERFHESEVPSISEINTILNNIQYGKINPERDTKRARALIALYYLTAGRLTEVVRKKGFETIAEPKEYVGICKQDISYDEVDSLPVMYVRLENRKNKKRKTKRQPIPISLEQPLIRHIEEYLKIVNIPNLPLFRFSSKRATQIINDTTGFNPHFWRHIRATHLVTLYDFNEQALIEYMGWTDARPAKSYMELSKKDLFRSFYKNQKIKL